MATAAASKTPEAAPRTFSFAPVKGITIPTDIPTRALNNPIVDEFFIPAFADIVQDDKVECGQFFPLAYFQGISDRWARNNGKEAKKLTTADARQKITDAFKRFQKDKKTASILELIMVNATGKEGIEEGGIKITEPGVRAWVRAKKG